MSYSQFTDSGQGDTSNHTQTFTDHRLNKMGTQSAWNYSEINKPRQKMAHRVALVSPRMDVDVTGVSFRNVRTHLIDHPRDEGLKHREQLWNFQHRYRGAIGKLKELGTGTGQCDQKNDNQSNNVDAMLNNTVRSAFLDQTSLSSRFQRRLRNKIRLASMRPGDYFDSARRRVSSREQKEEERRPGIQRLYSSGLIVKNTLYNQIKQMQSGERDDSKILEAIEKYGSLEKLPDIPYTSSSTSNTPHYRYLKSVSTYGRRTSDQDTERRNDGLRRSFTNISDVDTTKRRVVIVSKGAQQERFLHCLDSENDDEDDDDNDDDDDDDDECDNEPEEMGQGRLQKRDIDPRHPDHIAIRENITQIHSQDDMVLLEKQKGKDIKRTNGYITERTYCDVRRTMSIPRKGDASKENFECNGIRASATSSSGSSKSNHANKNKNDKTIRDSKQHSKKTVSKKPAKEDDVIERVNSEESLDIPNDRYGPTTHSIDKKLAIRKPWEWKPCPYRWIDKPYVRESDKPYIERIINRGEIIDEFNYDSFARTKPLKLQSFPEGAGYKDRYGNLR